MTYRELNDRLSKCESTLLQIQNGEYKSSNDKALKLTTEKLNILKESLTRQIKEADETMFVSTKGGTTKAVSMDRKTAMDLKSDSSITGIESAKGQKIKEEEGAPVEFTVEETKQIARSTGKALAKSLKDLGDEVAHMKAIEIVANTFKIDIEYKNNQSDLFSFDIVGSSLHIMNDGEDAELVDVGIKPSGEALVNVDVLTNELTKFFKSVNEGEISEAPAGVHYIKVENSELLEALGILEKAFDDSKVNFELNDPNIIYIHNADNGDMHDAVEELQQNGIIIDETSIDSELQNEQEIEGNQDGDDEALSPEELANKHAGSPMREEEGDLDVGHEDDEPSMLKSSAMETAEYAAKLYKKLQRYDNMDGEVDFPHWWQSKLVLAREYMSAAYHYLDSEEKQPALDQLALEENVDKVAGGIPYRRHGNKVIISEPLDDATKERLMAKAKDRGYFAQPNQSGGITITLKKGMYELSSDAREGLTELQGILDRASELGEEARDIVRTFFPDELNTAEAYDVFNFGSSSNSYDNTLESLIRDIEEQDGEDEGDDLDEGRKDDDALFPDNPRLPEIKKLADNIISMIKAEAAKGELGYIRTMEEIRYQQEHDFERTPEWNKAKGIRSDFDDYGSDTNEGDDLDEAAYDSATNNELAQYIINLSNQLKSAKANNDKKEIEHLQKDVDEVKAALARRKKVTEAGPGFAHDCAAKVVHEKYGKGTCIPEKHTLVKEGKKYVVTHYDVLFENNKTVVDIPVNELDIKTTNEHWHKGYKKKKK